MKPFESCEKFLMNCSELSRELTMVMPKRSLFPHVPLNTPKDFVVYCSILAILAFIIRLMDGIRDEERRFLKRKYYSQNRALCMFAFGVTSLIVNGGYMLLWLSTVCMNYAVILSVLIGWFVGDIVWIMLTKFISATRRSSKIYIQKPYREETPKQYTNEAESEFSTFNHYSIMDRNGVFNPAFVVDHELSDTFQVPAIWLYLTRLPHIFNI